VSLLLRSVVWHSAASYCYIYTYNDSLRLIESGSRSIIATFLLLAIHIGYVCCYSRHGQSRVTAVEVEGY